MIDPIFNMFKVKFDILDKMNIVDPIKDKIIVYINLEMVFKYLYTARVDSFLSANGDTADTQICIMSNIINLAQHYRLYFAKLGKDTEIILYCTDTSLDPDFINYKYNPAYRNHYINKTERNLNTRYVNNRVNAIWSPLDIIMQYVNEIYIVRSNRVEPSLIPYVLRDNVFIGDNIQHIVVSSFLYDTQYIGMGMTVIYPNRENSIHLTEKNVGDFIKGAKKCKNANELHPNFIPFVLSVMGDRYRSIPSIPMMGISTAINVLKEGIASWKITRDTSTDIILAELIDEDIRDIFISNYNTVKFTNQYLQLTPLDIESIVSRITNKYDDYSLNKMNEKYFTQHPLMLINSAREQIYNDNYVERNVFER